MTSSAVPSLSENKLERLRVNPVELAATRSAMHADAIDCSMHPSNPAGTFPGLPAFQLLSSQEALRLLATFPSSMGTGWRGFGFGVAWAALMSLSRRVQRPILAALLRVLVGGVVLFLAQVVFRRRQLQLQKHCSVTEDVSSAPTGPCRVICNVLTLSNSHAGTHADTPFHFARDPTAQPFSMMQYNGSAVVLDVATLLEEQGSRAITMAILEAVERSSGISLALQWRILFRTTKGVTAVAPAFFDIDAARYLASLPSLILIAVDSISVDNPTMSPICDGAHGAFLRERVAIVENVVLSNVPILKGGGAACGVMRTVFHPTQIYEDSWGCSVWFTPQ